MTIAKAIEILESVTSRHFHADGLDFRDAIKLGIEALKEVERLRSYKAFHVVKLLPGEDE